MTREEKLRELFNAAVENYRIAETSVIWEMSSNISADEDKLDAEVKEIITEFEEVMKPQPVCKIEARYGTPYYCPECEADQCKVEFMRTDGSTPEEKVSYCWACGQAIDWSVEYE